MMIRVSDSVRWGFRVCEFSREFMGTLLGVLRSGLKNRKPCIVFSAVAARVFRRVGALFDAMHRCFTILCWTKVGRCTGASMP